MRKIGRGLLWFAPIPIVAAVFFMSLPWLSTLDKPVNVSIAAAVSIFVMGWAVFLAMRNERAMDEVQRARERFGHQRGGIAGTLVMALLLLPTPFMDWVIDNLNFITTGSTQTAERDTVHVAMVFSFMLLMVMQALGNIIAQAIWNYRVGREA